MNMINCILLVLLPHLWHSNGVPKMFLKFSTSDSFHKLRPIVASICTFSDLVHFLYDLLSPLVPNDYFCKDTFSFVSQIKNANLPRGLLVS